MADIEYKGTIDFYKFIGAEIIKNDDDVEGIFIPIRLNGLYRAKKSKGVKLNFSCIKKADKFGQSHFMQCYFPKAKYEELRKNGMTSPIFGNLFKQKNNGKFVDERKVDKNKIVDAVNSDSDNFEF